MKTEKFTVVSFMCGVAIMLLLFVGCGNFTEHDVKISNNSSRDVRFTIKNYGDTVYALDSGDAITLELYNDPRLSFVGHPRVGYTSHTSVEIFDLTAYKCIVYNHQPYKMVITESGYRLGDESDDGGILIEGSHVEESVVVFPTVETVLYTENPSFIVKECGGSEREFSYTLKKYAETTDEKTETVYELHITL